MLIKNIYHKKLAFIVLDQSFSIRSKEIRTVDNIVAVELLKNPWIVEYESEIDKPKKTEIPVEKQKAKIKIPVVDMPFFETEKPKKIEVKIEKPDIKQVKKNISKVESNKIKKD